MTISGKAVFQSVPARAGTGLDYAAAVDKPVRGATVHLLAADGSVLATTTTDGAGDYSVVLPASQAVTVRVRAELKRSGAGNGDRDFTVLDNTSNGTPLYVLDSAAFTPTANATQNLRAASGWGGSSYTGTRAAAPFAILDVVYDAQAKVASVAPTVNLPALKLFWSRNNKTVDGDRASGDIGTSFFTITSAGRALYILGQQDVDTDEYDRHVVAHEFGHYLQSAVSRDDSVGGSHGSGDKLDMRVAFSEGWGNAWSGVVLGDPVYVDTLQTAQGNAFSIDVSAQPAAGERGWYSEGSGQYLIWTTNRTLGFGPVYAALTGLRTAPAFSSLYSFAAAVKAASSTTDAAAITALWATHNIVAQDAFGAGEMNNGGVALSLPVYKTHVAALGAAQNYCGSKAVDPDSNGNRLGEYVFVRFPAAGPRTLTLTRTAPAPVGSADPDFLLVKSDGSSIDAASTVVDVESLSTTLPTGTHSTALTDFQFRDTASGSTRCFDFKVN